ncbi:MAG: UbiA family prenyltransferase [Deltaproteobacteria bacterium]|nr:UbiA family prenyltransferase [Deltaproteobacteria bacterium]
MIKEKILTYGKMIKFSHTLFALPFALSAIVLALKSNPIDVWDILWVVVAMAGARSAAMGFNRIVDAKIDKDNPRTRGREIPSGRLKPLFAGIFVLISSGVFVFASFMLSTICFYLSFPLLIFLFSYSYTKRFTWLCHVYLGCAISFAPIGAWIGFTDMFSVKILFLSAALLTYIAGFDILYSLQDISFDKEKGLFSLPVKCGVKRSLFIARILHGVSLMSFLLILPAFDMGKIYLFFVGIIAVLFIVEHFIVRGGKLEHINVAFFHINSIISVIAFIGILSDVIF